MPIETFSRPAILSAMRNDPYSDPVAAARPAPVINQTVSPTSAAAPGIPAMPGEMMDNAPFQSQFGQRLVDQSFKGQNRTPWELAGNLAMLTSGYYQKSQEDAQQFKRDKNVGDYIKQHLPDMAPLWDAADSEQRKEIAKTARSTMLQRAEEARKRAQMTSDLKPINDALTSGASWEDTRKALIASGNPELALTGVKSGLDDLHEAAKAKRADARSASDKKAAYDEKYRQAIAAGASESQARAHAAGMNLETLNTAASVDDPYASAYELARDPKDRAALLGGAQKADEENRKTYRTQITAANNQMRTLGVVEGLVNNPNVYQGPASNKVHVLKQIGAGLGLKFGDGVGEEELMSSIANDLAKGARAGYPGAVSNFEYQTYLKSVISPGNTRQGNQAILDYLRDSARLQTAVNEDMAEWRKMKRERNPNAPALLDGTFNQWHEERQAQRIQALAEKKAAADAVVAGNKTSRVDQLNAQRAGQAPAAAPNQSQTMEAPELAAPDQAAMPFGNQQQAPARQRATDGKGNFLEWDGTKWAPVQ